MAATLKLTHRAIGVEVRRGTYDVVLDGERVGSLQLNDPIEIPVEPGPHTPASPQWPQLQPNQDLQRRRGRNRHLPMQREEHLADLSPVLRRSQPGTLAPSRVGPAPRVRAPSDRPQMLVVACSQTSARTSPAAAGRAEFMLLS
jgi:hypothetical protein